jgi:hypothetical protein
MAFLKGSRPLLQVRSGQKDTHDRFVILDDAVVWHLGASINGLGKKAFMMQLVRDASESAKVRSEFAAWWALGLDV